MFFKATQKFLTKISEEIDIELSDFWSSRCPTEGKIPFGDELYRYLTKISDRGLSVKTRNSLMDDPSEHENRMKHVESRHTNGVWLNDQQSVIFDKFRPT